jgi:hypothetical protein
MADSTVITSYPTWVQERWENTFDTVKDFASDAASNPPTYDAPDLDNGFATIIGQLPVLMGMDIDSIMDTYWDIPDLSSGLATKEDELYEQWQDYDDPAQNEAAIKEVVGDFLQGQLLELEHTLYPDAQSRFLSSNVVFSSAMARFVLDGYRKILNDGEKLGAELRLNSFDKGASRTVEMSKLAAQRNIYGGITRADIMSKKTMIRMQMEELKTRLASAVDQQLYQERIKMAATDYQMNQATAMWPINVNESLSKIIAALQGATPLRDETTPSAWNQLSSTQQTMSTISTALSAASAVSSIAKNISSWW